MSYQVNIHYSAIHEFFSSLLTFMTITKNHDLSADWYKNMEKSLSKDFLLYLKDNRLTNEEFCLLLLLIEQSPEKKDVPTFTAWLDKQSAGDIFEHVCSNMCRFPKDLNEVKERIITLMTNWNAQYFSTIEGDSRLFETLNESYKRGVALLNELPSEELIEKLTNGFIVTPGEEISQIILVPSYHIKPLSTFFVFEEMIIIFYPVDLPNDENGSPSLNLMRLSRAISDEKRLTILRLTRDNPLSFTELVKMTGIPKSNLHYHLTLLRTSGLLRVFRDIKNNQDRYLLRPGMLPTITQLLNEYIYE